MLLNEIFGRSDDNYGPADDIPDTQMQLTLCNPEDESGQSCVDTVVNIDYQTQPTEYEGPYLFYQGGVHIEGANLVQPVTFMGKTIPAGTQIAGQLIPYVWELRDKGLIDETTDPHDYQDIFTKYLEDHLDGKVKVPVRHYGLDW